MLERKGVGVKALMVMGALFAFALVVILNIGVFIDFMMEEEEIVVCDTFCEIRANYTGEGWRYAEAVDGYIGWGPFAPFGTSPLGYIGAARGWAGGQTFSSYVSDSLRENIRPEHYGCYCGVERASGLYIHVHGNPDEIDEFHMTDEDPLKHLTHYADPFDHRANLTKCVEAIEDNDNAKELGIHTLQDLEFYRGCVLFHTNDDDGCAIWLFDEDTNITNEQGPIVNQGYEERFAENLDEGDDIIHSLSIGEDVNLGNRHHSQRMLIDDFGAEGDDEVAFHLYSESMICNVTTMDVQRTDQDLQEACRKHCRRNNEMFWTANCFESDVYRYERLYNDIQEEYEDDVEEELCPETGEYPYCNCGGDQIYRWEVEDVRDIVKEKEEDYEEGCYGPGEIEDLSNKYQTCEEFCGDLNMVCDPDAECATEPDHPDYTQWPIQYNPSKGGSGYGCPAVYASCGDDPPELGPEECEYHLARCGCKDQ